MILIRVFITLGAISVTSTSITGMGLECWNTLFDTAVETIKFIVLHFNYGFSTVVSIF